MMLSSIQIEKSPAGQSHIHESAIAQVAGQAVYIDDIAEIQGTLYAAPIMSKVAHGNIVAIHTNKAYALEGVCEVVLANDIPGDAIFAAFAHDEAIFAKNKVEHIGQVIGLVVAKSVSIARRAAQLVEVEIEELPAVLEVKQALAQKNFVLPPVKVTRGNPELGFEQSAHILHGELEVGGQEHFYLEGQIAYALPQEQNTWLVYSSTQHPGEVQHWVAHALGIHNNQVTIECRRLGGGFGGKETQAGHMAVWASLAALKTKAPVKLRLDRDEDFMITGKRHPFSYEWKVGFDTNGKITALQLMMAAHCGFSADLSGPVADRAVFHADNAYFLENVEINSYRLKLNTQSHTAFRGFGGPQGVIVIETIMGDIARHLQLDPLAVRKLNYYGITERNTTHYQMKIEDNILLPLTLQLEQSSQYQERRLAIQQFNDHSPFIKKGLAITPVKFGISFTATLFNQAGATVHVYTDGTVQVNHGGVEMGQGLHTKVCQIAADTLGLSLDQIRITPTNTGKIPNASATAASAGTDLNGRAVQFAARNIRDNLAAFVAGLDGCGAGAIQFSNNQIHSPSVSRNFAEVVGMAYANRIQLWSDGFYRTPKIHYDKTTLSGRPFYYFAYGVACSEVAIDTLTGENKVLQVDILYDAGNSINPAIDYGQVAGGFVQGMGWLTTEELVWNHKGSLSTHAPSTYKIPTLGDIPADFKIDFWHEANPEDNVFGSKAVGEPPFMLAISIYEALRDALQSAKKASLIPNQMNTDEPIQLRTPATPENILKSLGQLK